MAVPSKNFGPYVPNLNLIGGMLEIDDIQAIIKPNGSGIVTAWQLTSEEVSLLIANGGIIYLNILANGIPPMYVSSHIEDVMNMKTPEV